MDLNIHFNYSVATKTWNKHVIDLALKDSYHGFQPTTLPKLRLYSSHKVHNWPAFAEESVAYCDSYSLAEKRCLLLNLTMTGHGKLTPVQFTGVIQDNVYYPFGVKGQKI